MCRAVAVMALDYPILSIRIRKHPCKLELNLKSTSRSTGAVAVMALERVPADIRKNGGVARMSDPSVIKEIQAAVTIPVMAKTRIGHYVEAQILEALKVDYIDESEVHTQPFF
jgi:pyridoxal biosynthesis lyase PdxS